MVHASRMNLTADARIGTSSDEDLSPWNGNIISDLLVFAVSSKNRKAVAVVFSIIYISIRYDDSIGHSLLDYVCANRMLLCQMMLNIMVGLHVNGSSSDVSSEDPVLEWVDMWALYMIQAKKLTDIFRIIGPTNNVNSDDNLPVRAFTHEQVYHQQLIEYCIWINSHIFVFFYSYS